MIGKRTCQWQRYFSLARVLVFSEHSIRGICKGYKLIWRLRDASTACRLSPYTIRLYIGTHNEDMTA